MITLSGWVWNLWDATHTHSALSSCPPHQGLALLLPHLWSLSSQASSHNHFLLFGTVSGIKLSLRKSSTPPELQFRHWKVWIKIPPYKFVGKFKCIQMYSCPTYSRYAVNISNLSLSLSPYLLRCVWRTGVQWERQNYIKTCLDISCSREQCLRDITFFLGLWRRRTVK